MKKMSHMICQTFQKPWICLVHQNGMCYYTFRSFDHHENSVFCAFWWKWVYRYFNIRTIMKYRNTQTPWNLWSLIMNMGFKAICLLFVVNNLFCKLYYNSNHSWKCLCVCMFQDTVPSPTMMKRRWRVKKVINMSI